MTNKLSQKEELEYKVLHDYPNEIQLLKTSLQKKKYPLPNLKSVYEKYPAFEILNGSSKYVATTNLYASQISSDVEKFNKEKKDGYLMVINSLLAGLEDYILNNYPGKHK
jgi:hypothetical protein